MFKINSISIFDGEDNSYTYDFQEGVNYIRADNSKGKTVFYQFIDYILGGSLKSNLEGAEKIVSTEMIFEYKGHTFKVCRVLGREENYFYLDNQETAKPIDSTEYKSKLNSIFSSNDEEQRKIKEFTGENITFRQFTMFNFLGENRQGQLQNFWDKASDIKYSVRLNPLMNYIFNPHLEEISKLLNVIKHSKQELAQLETETKQSDFFISEINKNLNILGIKVQFSGLNKDKILDELNTVKQSSQKIGATDDKSLADLLTQKNSLDEQIKIYRNNISVLKQDQRINKNRSQMLQSLKRLIDENEEYKYLVEPIEQVLHSIEGDLDFSNYIIKDKTVEALEKQSFELKRIINRKESGLRPFSLEDKVKAIVLLEEYLQQDFIVNNSKLEQLKTRIRELRKKLNELQNEDDKKKISNLSKNITDIYISSSSVSKFVLEDVERDNFFIEFIKNGCILQPKISKGDSILVGSKARKTLIQLSGYIAFIKMLLEEGKYPVIPLLVLDHISKDFSEENQRAVGYILNELNADEDIVQIIMFDDKRPEDLNLNEIHYIELDLGEEKSGFNPFI